MTERALPRDDARAIPSAQPVDRVQHHHINETEWEAIERDPDFRELVREKRDFILPAMVFFIVYYFSLPILVGYFPDMMSREVIGHINVAYLFALSQFIMAWILMSLYVKRAGVFDAIARRIIEKVKGGKL